MRHPHPSSPPPPSRLRRAATAVAVVVGLFTIYSCSLLVETRDTQCQADTDCTTFSASAKCDLTRHICIGPSSSSSSGTASSSGTTSSSGGTCDRDGGIDAGGCSSCPATDDRTLLNHCTSGCIPFDNGRVKSLPAGGKLPSLPSPGPDGGM